MQMMTYQWRLYLSRTSILQNILEHNYYNLSSFREVENMCKINAHDIFKDRTEMKYLLKISFQSEMIENTFKKHKTIHEKRKWLHNSIQIQY